MLLARLLAFLAMLLLAPVAQAGPGDPTYGPGLIDAEALVEAAHRPTLADADTDGADALPARAAREPRHVTRSACQPPPPQRVTEARHRRAQPRAPPFLKA